MKKLVFPFPSKLPDGKANPAYFRYRYLTSKKEMTPAEAEKQVNQEMAGGTRLDNRVGNGGSKKREDGGNGGKKPAALVKKGLVSPGKPRKSPPVKRNGDGAVAVSGEDLLGDPRVPEAVKEQIRASAHAPPVEESHQPHTDGPQRQDIPDRPEPLPAIDPALLNRVAVGIETLEKAVTNCAVCLTEICDKLDTVNRNLAKGRP